MINQNKRERLIESASILFHRNGLTTTSLADIAKHADIPIGNVYYYFKTKEELAIAAVSKRKEQFTGAYALLESAIDDPRQRLIEAVKTYDKGREDYARYGCPVMKIIDEVPVEKDNVAKLAAQILSDFVEWAASQFRQLGHSDDARRFATMLMGDIQGAILMAKAFQNPQAISDEVNRLTFWLECLPNKKIQLGKIALRA